MTESPWIDKEYKTSNGHTVRVGSISVDDRIAALRGFGIKRVKDVILYPGTQRTVRRAAERRLRKLVKETGGK